MTKVNTDKNRINEIFDRGVVVEVLPTKDALIEKLLSGKRLKIYIGADPTSDTLHLSHAKNYMFLEELRQLGHEVIVLVGDFTARIGDPSDRSAARQQLSEEQIEKNVEGWISQIKPLLNFDDEDNPPKILYNSEWLSKLSFKDVVSLASNFTVQQIMERDMFEKRLKENTPIYLHEFLYPLMQGYDSVAMEVDVELCGTDQIFNALAGRTLLKRLKNKDKFVIAVNLMANPKTGELMSKSRGVGVFLSSPPNEMYGAIMAQPDEMIEVLFINCTRIPLSQKDKILNLGPRLAKARIAREIVEKFYGSELSKAAEYEFDKTFKDGGTPEEIMRLVVAGARTTSTVLIENKLVSSKSEWRRLIEEGAVKKEDGTKIDDPDFIPKEPTILKIGKRRFVEVSPPPED